MFSDEIFASALTLSLASSLVHPYCSFYHSHLPQPPFTAIIIMLIYLFYFFAVVVRSMTPLVLTTLKQKQPGQEMIITLGKTLTISLSLLLLPIWQRHCTVLHCAVLQFTSSCYAVVHLIINVSAHGFVAQLFYFLMLVKPGNVIVLILKGEWMGMRMMTILPCSPKKQ